MIMSFIDLIINILIIAERAMKHSKIFWLLAIWLSVLNISFVTAQYRVSGRLLDKQEKTLQGATILFMQGDSLVAGGMSDANGAFNIEGLLEGRYRICFSLIGYKTTEQILDV